MPCLLKQDFKRIVPLCPLGNLSFSAGGAFVPVAFHLITLS